jgi:hypothetical protein
LLLNKPRLVGFPCAQRQSGRARPRVGDAFNRAPLAPVAQVVGHAPIHVGGVAVFRKRGLELRLPAAHFDERVVGHGHRQLDRHGLARKIFHDDAGVSCFTGALLLFHGGDFQ